MLNRFSFKSIKKAFLVILFFTAVGSPHGYGTDMGPLVVVPAEPTNEDIVTKAREVLESTKPDFLRFKRLLGQRRTNLASLKEPLEKIQTETGKNLLRGCLEQDSLFSELPEELVDIFGIGALNAALKAVGVEKGVTAAALFLKYERRCEGPLPDFLKMYAQANVVAAVTEILTQFYPSGLLAIFENVPLTAEQKEALCPTLMAWRNKSGQTLAHHFFLSPLALFRLSEITGPEFLDIPDNMGKTVFEDPHFTGELKKNEIDEMSKDFLALVTEKVKPHIVKALAYELGQLSKGQLHNLDNLLGFLVDFPFDADQKEAVKGMLMAWRSGPEAGNGTLAHKFAKRSDELLPLLALTGADILTIPNAAGTLPLHAGNLVRVLSNLDATSPGFDVIKTFVTTHLVGELGEVLGEALGTRNIGLAQSAFEMSPALFGSKPINQIEFMFPYLVETPAGRQFLRGYGVGEKSLLQHYVDTPGSKYKLGPILQAYQMDGVVFSHDVLDLNREGFLTLYRYLGADHLKPFVLDYTNSQGENLAHGVAAGLDWLPVLCEFNFSDPELIALFTKPDLAGKTPLHVALEKGQASALLRRFPQLAPVKMDANGLTFLVGFALENPEEYQTLMAPADDYSSEDEEDDALEPEKLGILSEASKISDRYGVSAESVAGMHEAFLKNEDGVDSFRAYVTIETLKKQPSNPAIWRDMWGFPEGIKLFFGIMQQPKDFLDPFLQKTYNPSLRQSVNATWSEVFNLRSGNSLYPKYKTQMAHSVQFLDGFMECLTPDAKDEDDVNTSVSFVNVLSGHSSFGFNPNRRATDDEANVMVSALLKLGLRARAQGHKEFFTSFKQDPVDDLDAHAMVILNNHQLVCAQIAMVGYLAGVDRVNAGLDDDVFVQVDRAINNSHALFGESSSKATFRKRSEGGAIPDAMFERTVDIPAMVASGAGCRAVPNEFGP